jgi:hemoglobin
VNGLGDIGARADLERLVNGFYASVRADPVLGPIFDDVARTNWDEHLPKMYDFWETVLFGTGTFRGKPLAVHLALAARVPLTGREFQRWLELFEGQVDAMFAGPIAEEAKCRAARIAAVMQHHLAAYDGSLASTVTGDQRIGA